MIKKNRILREVAQIKQNKLLFMMEVMKDPSRDNKMNHMINNSKIGSDRRLRNSNFTVFNSLEGSTQ